MRRPAASSRAPRREPVFRADRPRFRALGERHLDALPELDRLSPEDRFAMKVVAKVLPFRVNRFVIDELIDWDVVPDDPIFRLTFPQPEMLSPESFALVADALRSEAEPTRLRRLVDGIRRGLNPNPAGQKDLNVPHLDGHAVAGLQHKYRETVLFFPAAGQTCHAHCTFCFRWPQFVGVRDLRFAATEAAELREYLLEHPEVTDVLITGGDPMVMKTRVLETIVAPLLEPGLEHVQTVRFGTKALTFWPHRFVSDPDADDLLRLFERFGRAGRHVALMAHFNHPRELAPRVVKRAIRRIRRTGAVIRTQSPLLARINDDAAVWESMWREQVRLGCIPYYMFMARDTGAQRTFEVPLVRAWEIYRGAITQVSGLSRTVRGPSMSADPGKVEVQGVAEVAGERVFVLRFIQARNPDWVQRPFLARFDPEAVWLGDLEPPALHGSSRNGRAGERLRFFFEDELREMRKAPGG